MRPRRISPAGEGDGEGPHPDRRYSAEVTVSDRRSVRGLDLEPCAAAVALISIMVDRALVGLVEHDMQHCMLPT